jgi:hypothetical protein
MRKQRTVRQKIEYAVIMELNVGQWVTRGDIAEHAATSKTNGDISKTLNELVSDGYLNAVSLSQFHPMCRTIVYVRTNKGFDITPKHQQMMLDLI